ncbi:MAG: agmatinase [Candidatus Bathyarchaeota archaeon]|nr:agmatinase [Candidatus Bathyarchaeota archaeon]
MSNLELFTSQPNVFSGFQKPLEQAKYIVFGVPFDVTSTYRTGARFMPTAVRQASLNIETYSFRTAMDVEELPLHDVGDLHVSTDPKETVNTLKTVVEDIVAAGKIPVAIGGEHTITLGIMKGFGAKAEKTAIVSFDAHLDLRKEFMGLKLSHTTFMQLVNEEVKPAKIIEVGTRAVCQDELKYAKKAGIEFFSTQQIKNEGTQKIIEQLKRKLEPYENVYLSVDMDIVDPAFAPAVQNPEADGISTGNLLDIGCALCDKRVVGFDVLEVAPIYDQGISAIAAAKVMFEMLCQMEKTRKPH